MVNYQDGKIYKIVCNTTGLVYVGSTTHKLLSQRLSKHVSSFNLFLRGSDRYITSYKVLENNNYEIVLIENCKCNDKNELLAKERYHIQNTDCVNIVVPLRTNKEYVEDNLEKFQEWRKQYWIQNKERISEYHKNNKHIRQDYYEEHKEEIIQRVADWKQNNKDKVKINSARYFEKYKDRQLEKGKLYRQNHKEEGYEYQKKYKEDNKERIKIRNKLYGEKRKMFLDFLKCFNV